MSFKVFVAAMAVAIVSVIMYDHTGGFQYLLSTLVCAGVAALSGAIATVDMDNEE